MRTGSQTAGVSGLYTATPTPIRWPPLQKCSDSTEIAFMAEKIRLFYALAPEFDGEGQGVDCLLMATNEGATEVDALEIMLLRLQVCDLTDVVATQR